MKRIDFLLKLNLYVTGEKYRNSIDISVNEGISLHPAFGNNPIQLTKNLIEEIAKKRKAKFESVRYTSLFFGFLCCPPIMIFEDLSFWFFIIANIFILIAAILTVKLIRMDIG